MPRSGSGAQSRPKDWGFSPDRPSGSVAGSGFHLIDRARGLPYEYTMVRSTSRLTKIQNPENPSKRKTVPGKSILFLGSSKDETCFRDSLRAAQLDNGVTAFHTAEEARLYLIRVECGADYTAHLWPGVIVLHFDSSGDEGFRLLDWLNDNRAFGEFIVVAVAYPNKQDLWQRGYEAGLEAYYSEPIPVSRLHALAEAFPRCWKNGVTAGTEGR
jgi:hypothetical protein